MSGGMSVATRFRCALFLFTAFAWLASGSASVSATTWPECDEVCSTSSCGDSCYLNQMEFDNGNSISCYAYGEYDFDQECCGDGICQLDAGESVDDCTADCNVIGHACNNDSLCELGENCANCPADCDACQSAATCNDNGKCDVGEDKTCGDCQATGFCNSNTDCGPETSSWGFTYRCFNHYCMIDEDLIGHICSTAADCPGTMVSPICLWTMSYPNGDQGICVDLN